MFGTNFLPSLFATDKGKLSKEIVTNRLSMAYVFVEIR